MLLRAAVLPWLLALTVLAAAQLRQRTAVSGEWRQQVVAHSKVLMKVGQACCRNCPLLTWLHLTKTRLLYCIHSAKLWAYLPQAAGAFLVSAPQLQLGVCAHGLEPL